MCITDLLIEELDFCAQKNCFLDKTDVINKLTINFGICKEVSHCCAQALSSLKTQHTAMCFHEENRLIQNH